MDYAASDIEFAVLGVVRDPILDFTRQLAKNVQRLQDLDVKLNDQYPTWRETFARAGNTSEPEGTLLGPDENYGVSDDMLAEYHSSAHNVEHTRHSIDDLILSRMTLVESQNRIRSLIGQEREASLSDEAKCEERKFDYSHIIFDWLTFHAKNGSMREVLDTA